VYVFLRNPYGRHLVQLSEALKDPWRAAV
jgi:hypothetical protein